MTASAVGVPAAGRQTLQQRRAGHAWQSVQAARLEKDGGAAYRDQAKRLAPRILTAGLGPASAFLEAKKYAPLLRQHLADWLTASGRVATTGTSLTRFIMEGDADRLRRLTAEALEWLAWTNRCAEVELAQPEDPK